MMAVSIALGAGKAAGEDVRTESADHPHHVSQRNVVTVPLIECLFSGFGVPEVRHAAEALLHTIVFIGLEKLQRAQHA